MNAGTFPPPGRGNEEYAEIVSAVKSKFDIWIRLSICPPVEEKYVDILFANEEEIKALTGMSPEDGAAEIKDLVEIVVVKLGAEGSFCVCDEGMVRIGVRPAKAIDTTGAGDLYAAGFIYGHMKGASAENCGKMGAILAGRVIELIGAKMDESHWENLRREILALEN